MTEGVNPCRDEEVALPRCELCGALHTYRAEPACACGRVHRVCDRCCARWGLAADIYPVTERRFTTCPGSDEFRAAFALGGG